MTFTEFDKFFDEFVEECRKMRDTKGKEYANSENRFDNFNRIAKQIGISNAQVGMVYLTKHMDSIQSYLKTGKIHSEERIRGRFIDAVTYLILMAGMCSETEWVPLRSPYDWLPCNITSINGNSCVRPKGHTGHHQAHIEMDKSPVEVWA